MSACERGVMEWGSLKVARHTRQMLNSVARARCLSGREPGPLTGGRRVIHLSCFLETSAFAHYCDARATHNDEKQPYGVSPGSEFLFKIDGEGGIKVVTLTWRDKKKKVDFC